MRRRAAGFATNHFISVSTGAGRSFTETDVRRQRVVGF